MKMREQMYKSQIQGVSDLKQFLMKAWFAVPQRVSDEASSVAFQLTVDILNTNVDVFNQNVVFLRVSYLTNTHLLLLP